MVSTDDAESKKGISFKAKLILRCIFVGILFTTFASVIIIERLKMDISGVIVESNTVKDPSGPYRYWTNYKIKTEDGKILDYSTASNDNDLKGGLPVGTTIHKERNHINYTVNGVLIEDFPIYTYKIHIIIGLALILIGIALYFIL